jgi:hypothetical protein
MLRQLPFGDWLATRPPSATMPSPRALTSLCTAVLLWLVSATAVRVMPATHAHSVRVWDDHGSAVGLPPGRVARVAQPAGVVPSIRHTPPLALLRVEPFALLAHGHAIAQRGACDDGTALHRADRLSFPYDATAPPASTL